MQKRMRAAFVSAFVLLSAMIPCLAYLSTGTTTATTATHPS